MSTPIEKQDGYITLKEASERFGYSADYIGQLIRKGKIEGKQVYANVVWMTTPEAMEAYLLKEKPDDDTPTPVATAPLLIDRLMERALPPRVLSLYRSALYALLILLAVFAIFLCYMLVDSFDAVLRKHAPAVEVHTYRPNTPEHRVGATHIPYVKK